MNKELQRIKIAEACGWTEISERCMWGLPPNATDDGSEDCLRHFPKYESDLNAMHEAEKVLLTKDGFCGCWETYSNILTASMGCTDIFHATAAQRAEAFLKTLGLWEEES